MRALGWQDALAALLALAALAWLVARRLRARKGAACVDCPGCSIATRPHPTAAPPATGAGGTLIPLSELTRHDR